MARPSFNTVVPGGWVTTRSHRGSASGTLSGHTYGRETVTGTNRRKPNVAFVPPTPYSLKRDVVKGFTGDIFIERTHDRKIYPSAWERMTGAIGVAPPDTIFPSVFGLTTLGTLGLVYQPQGVPTEWIDNLLAQARANMKNTKVNLGVAFAERNKTAQLVGDTALQLACAMKKLRKGDFRGAQRCLGIAKPKKPRGSSVPQRWLELQYGWKPLLNDVYGSAQALAGLDGSDWLVTSTASRGEPINVSYQHPDAISARYGFGKATGHRGCFVRIDAVPVNDLMRSFTSLGITNPSLIGWELVPYSFVVDWFLPVGTFLDSLDAMLGFGPSWFSISRIEKFKIEYSLMGGEFTTVANPGTWLYRKRAEAGGSRHYVDLSRGAGEGVPFPSFPRIKDPRSLGHMANGLALLAGAFGR